MDTSLVKGKKTRNITLLFVTYLAALSVGWLHFSSFSSSTALQPVFSFLILYTDDRTP
jgi:hypothetical protein